MSMQEFATIAASHFRNGIAESLYINTGIDVTHPVTVYGTVNEICNYKCQYCEFWRMPNYRPEMSIAEWQKAILDLKEFVGKFHIQFSGGEPYLKKGFVDLLTFCHDNSVTWGVVTNGSAFLSDKIVKTTVDARPFNINISVDSMRPEIHDNSREYQRVAGARGGRDRESGGRSKRGGPQFSDRDQAGGAPSQFPILDRDGSVDHRDRRHGNQFPASGSLDTRDAYKDLWIEDPKKIWKIWPGLQRS